MKTIKGCLTVADPGTKGLGVPFSESFPLHYVTGFLLDFYLFVRFPQKSCKIGNIPLVGGGNLITGAGDY